MELYTTWLEGTLAGGTDDWALGRERHDRMVEQRAFDGLDADEILELGQQQLAEERAARRAAAARSTPKPTSRGHRADQGRPRRRRSPGPSRATATRCSGRATTSSTRPRDGPRRRAHRGPRDPEYLRNVIPFAAYFAPAAFDASAKGIYVVTPSVDDDPNAMREHNRASISNTSIHEAYPGHHLQLDVARRHPSLTRLLTDAPEFVEGWGMYSELMMREQGFDAGPEFRVMLHTDAIWRACRIILDVRLHRGELRSTRASTSSSSTRLRAAQRSLEVERYTYRPTYPLRYLLGRR